MALGEAHDCFVVKLPEVAGMLGLHWSPLAFGCEVRLSVKSRRLMWIAEGTW